LGASFPNQLKAQEKVVFLSLDEAIEKSQQQNRSILLAKMDETIALSHLKQTDAIYLPQVGFSYTAMSTNNPLNAFGFKLQQQSITAADFNPDLLNHPNGTPDFSTKLDVLQPILNMDLIYQKKAAEKQNTVYQYQTQRTKENIRFEVQKAYLQLGLVYASKNVLEEALATSKSVLVFTENRFKQGLIQKSDLLNSELQVRSIETNLAKTRENISNASDYLSLLMGQTTGIIYKVSPIISQSSSIQENQTLLQTNRADFMAMQKAIEASDLGIEASKKSYLPKLNAFGSYQLNDSKMFGFGANAYLAGIQLSWDIFKGNRTKNNINSQVLERNKLSSQLEQQIEQGQLELNKTYRELQHAKFEMLQQEKAVEQATESLRIIENRYQQGLVNTTDVLMASTQLAQQKLALVQAIFNRNTSIAQIEYLSSSTTK
jgi:outer membrane protein TolC